MTRSSAPLTARARREARASNCSFGGDAHPHGYTHARHMRAPVWEGAGRRLSRTASLSHPLDETLQNGEPVVPDLRVAEVDTDDGQQLRG